MKLFWIGLVTLLLATHLSSSLVPPAIIRKCVDSTKVQAVDLALVFGTEFRMSSTPVKCYFTCLFETTGMAMNGKISDDLVALANNPAEIERFKELIEVCSNLNAEGECEPTYQAFRCWMKQGKH